MDYNKKMREVTIRFARNATATINSLIELEKNGVVNELEVLAYVEDIKLQLHDMIDIVLISHTADEVFSPEEMNEIMLILDVRDEQQKSDTRTLN